MTTPMAFPLEADPPAGTDAGREDYMQTEIEPSQDTAFLDCGRDI